MLVILILYEHTLRTAMGSRAAMCVSKVIKICLKQNKKEEEKQDSPVLRELVER